jgi:hypothetical protein
MKITHLNEIVVGSLGRPITLRIEYDSRGEWWPHFCVCSDALGEVGPRERNDKIFYNNRWFALVNGFRGKYGICVFEGADSQLVLGLLGLPCPKSVPKAG